MDRSAIIALLSVVISLISLSISSAGFWLAWLRRGRLSMTKPTLVFFGYDTVPVLTPKVFLRALLFSTSVRGQIIEGMHIKLRRGPSEQIFSFLGYGEAGKLMPGSGLYVGPTGHVANHHFVLSGHEKGYSFLEGHYNVTVYARVAGRSMPTKLIDISIDLSNEQALILSGNRGILFELGWNTVDYIGTPMSNTKPQ